MGEPGGYEPATYGDRIAGIYDRAYPTLPTEATVEFLAGLAGAGPVLELAIGTGRVALPLGERGVEVHGVDTSEAMVAKLRAKPGGERIRVTMGDMADVPVEGTFPLVYLIFNTFFALLTQEDQLRCFRNVAAHLDGDGAFVLEAFVPDLGRFDRGQRVSTTRVEVDEVWLDASRHFPTGQRIESQHVVFDASGAHLYPVHLRYAFPSELDLMARLAGLELRDRFGGWDRRSFDDGSGAHVSVYGPRG